MPDLIMLKGLPASGKTTWAKEYVESFDKNAVKRVNKDDLRAMLDNGRYSKGSEKFVLSIRDYIVQQALVEGKHVVVDDTNLDPKHEETLRDLANMTGARFVVKDEFLEVSKEECIRRNSLRKNPVPESAIEEMYDRYLKPKDEDLDKYEYAEQNELLPIAIIVDIDGTMAIRNGRNWTEYDKVITDTPNMPVVELVDSLSGQYTMVFVSGRPDSCFDDTREWINNVTDLNDNFYLFMRKTGDVRKDYTVKREIYENHIQDVFHINFVIDDRNQVVDMWRNELKLPCFQVAEGNF